MQKALDQLYIDYLKSVVYGMPRISNAILGDDLSSPYFVNSMINGGAYENAKTRVIIVGRETNGWFGKDERKRAGFGDTLREPKEYLEALTNLYFKTHQDRGDDKLFYKFISKVEKRLCAAETTVGVLCSNLLRHDNAGRVPKDIEEIITCDSNSILAKEIQILQPSVVIFCCGHAYDDVLYKTFPDMKFELAEMDCPMNEFAIIQSKQLPKWSFRVYHPNGMNRHNKGFFERFGMKYMDALADRVTRWIRE